MRKIRSTFRRRPSKGSGTNTAALAYRSFRQNVNHYARLHSERRERSASELDTMRLAAVRRPAGFAAAYLAEKFPSPKKARAKKAAA